MIRIITTDLDKIFNINNMHVWHENIENIDSFSSAVLLTEIMNIDEKVFLFDIDKFIELCDIDISTTINPNNNLNIMLKKEYLKQPFAENIEWSIPIINFEDLNLVQIIAQKYQNITIRNIVLFRSIFHTDLYKLREYTVIDLVKEECAVIYTKIT